MTEKLVHDRFESALYDPTQDGVVWLKDESHAEPKRGAAQQNQEPADVDRAQLLEHAQCIGTQTQKTTRFLANKIDLRQEQIEIAISSKPRRERNNAG